MKALTWLAVLFVLFVPSMVHAACPIQPSAVAFVNGIGDTWDEANDSRVALDEKIRTRLGISLTDDCLHSVLAYNRSINVLVDLAQAVYQKARELGILPVEAWAALLRLASPAWFDDVIDQVYPRSGDGALYVVGAQLQQHVDKFYLPEIQSGRHLVIVGHSQGNFYANDAWKKFTEDERSHVNLVAVATPATEVAGGGPYTTLTNDALASLFFAFALPPNKTNAGFCDVTSNPLTWFCHGMDTSYLHGTNSRTKIENDIVAVLPTDVSPGILGTVEGYTYAPDCIIAPNATQIQIWRLEPSGVREFVGVTESNEAGYYRVALPPGEYYLGLLGTPVTVSAGQTTQRNVGFGAESCPLPPLS